MCGPRSTDDRQRGVDDTSALQLEFTEDRVAHFLVTQSATGFFYDVKVIGRAGSITLRGRNFVQFEIEVQSDALPAWREPTSSGRQCNAITSP